MNTVSQQVRITIDGKEYLVDENTTVLEAAEQNAIPIPTLCHHPALSDWGGCRLCVVEVDDAPKLVASCVTRVRNGMRVVTTNDRIVESRRTILEFLFAERNHNCMICPRSGDCELQQLAYDLGMDHVSAPFSFEAFPTDVTSEYMALDHNRCVLCGRCIRACREIVGADVLGFHHRGSKTMVGLDLMETREQSTCMGCGACLQVCPTGAIYNRYRPHSAVKGHPEADQVRESVCPLCGLLCPTTAHLRDGRLTSVNGVMTGNNDRLDRGQLCRRGRFEIFKDPGQRLIHPLQREPGGDWERVGWDQALNVAAARLEAVKSRYGTAALFGWTSSMASNEELLLFREMMAGVWSAASIDTFDGKHLRNISRLLQGKDAIYREFPWQRIPTADMILVVGAAPYATHPLLASLIHRMHKEQGAFLAAIAPRAFPLPRMSHHLTPEYGDLPHVVKALCAAVKTAVSNAGAEKKSRRRTTRGENEDRQLPKAGLGETETAVFNVIVEAYAAASKPLIITGDALTGLQDHSALEALKAMALLKHDSSDTLNLMILKSEGNSSGAWRMGAADIGTTVPCAQLKGGVIRLSGQEDAAGAAVSHLENLEFLLVFSPYIPEKIRQKANLLIPIPTWLETDGSYMSLDGRESAYRRATLPPPDGVHPFWQTLCRMMETTGFLSAAPTWEAVCRKARISP